MSETGRSTEFAPAKVNLTLHVTGRRGDGYHVLDALAVFPKIGDVLDAATAPDLTLKIDGRFADKLSDAENNFVLRAAQSIQPAGTGAALRLTKNLPVAGGVGGGSADAAAALRLLARLWQVKLPAAADVLALGADVPVCLASVAQRMRGIGERLTPVAGLPPFWLVLANAGTAVSTSTVFAALGCRFAAAMPDALPALRSFRDLTRFLHDQRNDLEPPAIATFPAIGTVLQALRASARCELARMSGSGGTCFGLFATRATALSVRKALRAAHPGWWVEAAPVEDRS